MRIQPRERRFLECRLAQNSRIFGELSRGTLSGYSPAGLNPIEYGNAGRLDGGTPGICLRIEDLSGYTGSLI
jgi:hypothetical protein